MGNYQQVFTKPKELPPQRSHDHRIPLLLNQGPVAMRPYRYSHFQKNEIEKLIKEMLATGTIRPSTSPYSSPMLVVKKQDGRWRMCVDYRALNNIIVKDKFLIPVIDELLDELARADLRKFELVFFDDILVYSKTWGAHLEHLKKVFDLLQAHGLRMKIEDGKMPIWEAASTVLGKPNFEAGSCSRSFQNRSYGVMAPTKDSEGYAWILGFDWVLSKLKEEALVEEAKGEFI